MICLCFSKPRVKYFRYIKAESGGRQNNFLNNGRKIFESGRGYHKNHSHILLHTVYTKLALGSNSSVEKNKVTTKAN